MAFHKARGESWGTEGGCRNTTASVPIIFLSLIPSKISLAGRHFRVIATQHQITPIWNLHRQLGPAPFSIETQPFLCSGTLGHPFHAARGSHSGARNKHETMSQPKVHLLAMPMELKRQQVRLHRALTFDQGPLKYVRKPAGLAAKT